ncbi:Oxoglutarate/iron-dependent dioxygenase [Corchorus capsularis]|uniref:Oxoglutarate/iron-dependent dioxygenase n=1 Tax=Corchorus capsularis TaxID=210143 RepID=A0A1R3FYV1_COCAP|nr:Oxoglutarate/iron-dependent dioxygenase [Corchorus capsularis]
MPSLRGIVRSQLCRLSTADCVSRQIPPPFCTSKKITFAQKPSSNRAANSSIAADMASSNVTSSVKQRRSSQFSQAMEYSGTASVNKEQSQSSYAKDFPTLTVSIGSSSKGRNSKRYDVVNSSEHEGVANIASPQNKSSTFSVGHNGKKNVNVRKSPSGNSESVRVVGNNGSDCSESLPKVERFNICSPVTRDSHIQRVLRPGMVLLKRYISLYEQINIVKTCQTLGAGPGGFYRPGYKDGAKLCLNMMCLGLNWNPQTRNYDKRHPVDDCEPPSIPFEFQMLVQRAIQDAHCLIDKHSTVSNAEDILPSMSPDLCIINFYTTHGRLGLHQDRDESKKSLRKRLPVVSVSIGHSAEFLYSDQRSEDQADKVVLDSGDVLIFGGESRMVFHGVPYIIPNSAPRDLLAETGLRHGRLNLTFRQL